MGNEYRESLRVYGELLAEDGRFLDIQAEGHKVPEGDIIALLLKIECNWNLMIAVEQREWCMQAVLRLGSELQVRRNQTGRRSVWGTGGSYCGIFGQDVKAEEGVAGRVMHTLQDSGTPREIYSLRILKKMAKAVDAYEARK